MTAESYPAALKALAIIREVVGDLLNRSLDHSHRELEKHLFLLRPPGHHAQSAKPMGFCIFNNAAFGARMIYENTGKKIFIFDFDVHHGNGTQELFYEEKDIFYASMHGSPLFPGTGKADERGEGEGRGRTLNLPLRAGTGDEIYLEVFRTEILPALEDFSPSYIILSSGFDAHRLDPLGNLSLTENAFGEISRALQSYSERNSVRAVLSFLEGGYHLPSLKASLKTHVKELIF